MMMITDDQGDDNDELYLSVNCLIVRDTTQKSNPN